MAEQSSLVRLLEAYELELDWRGFELHPEIPPGGTPLSSYLRGAPRDEIGAQLQRFATGFGVEGMVIPDWLSNTRRALAVAELARNQGKLEAFRCGVMEAYWRQGADVEDKTVLAEIATSVGLAAKAAQEAADHPRYLGRVDALRMEAAEAGVVGIPTFFFGAGPPVVGCQPFEVLARAAEAAGACRKVVNLRRKSL